MFDNIYAHMIIDMKCGLLKKSYFWILSKAEHSYISIILGLKKYSNWPTYPQLYAKGELLGGLDIVKELAESGELKEQLPKQTSLEDRYFLSSW